MKKILTYIKKINPHIVIPVLILISIAGTIFFIAKWAKGVNSTYDRDAVEDGYEIEVLDRVYYVYPDNLAGHIPNDTKKVLCFGNSPFSDDRDSANNLCNLMAEKTGAEIVNLSVPNSYLSMGSPKITVSDPLDYHTFYWLMCFATLDDKDTDAILSNYNRVSRGISEIGDNVVDYLCDVDLNTVDTIVLMYDATDYLNGRIKETPDNISNPLTFCGNMLAGIELIQSRYPHIQIIIMSPTYAYALDENGDYISSDIIKVEGESLSSYALTQLNICQLTEVTFIDNIYGTVHADNADMYLIDNVHLNVEGRELVAERFAKIFKATWDRYYDTLEK